MAQILGVPKAFGTRMSDNAFLAQALPVDLAGSSIFSNDLNVVYYNCSGGDMKSNYCQASFSRAGFTLLEIIVVVFILSLLVAIVAPKIMGRTDDAKIADAKVQIKNFETALKLFKIDNGFYPATEQGLEALIEKPATGQIPNKYRDGGYLEQKKIPVDPWGNAYVYVSPGVHGDFDILSYGGDGKEGGEGKDADIKSWDMQ